jgi:hypothetical protein
VIVVRTTIVEQGINRQSYDDFIVALAAEGLPARIEQPNESRSFGAKLAAGAATVGIWVANAYAGDLVVEAIKCAASKTIGRALPGLRQQTLKRLPIYAPNGRDVPAWVDLPAEGPSAPE